MPKHARLPVGCYDVWCSKTLLVQLYEATDRSPVRMSVFRVGEMIDGRFPDGISWDELQQAKSEVGFGDIDAVEIYPRDSDVVNVANARHLFLIPEGVPFRWKSE